MHAQSCPTLCDPMNHSTPGLPVHHQLPEFTQIHVRRVSDAIQPSHLILCRLRLLLLPPILPSIKVFSSESTLRMRWPEYWSFSIIPSKGIPGLTCAGVWGLILRVWVPAHSPNSGEAAPEQDLLEEPCAPA